LQGYGAIKSTFESFLDKLSKMNIDIVVVAHASIEKDGDNVRNIPKVTGGSWDILMGVSDLVGYVETIGNDIVLDFTPRDRHYGKNFPQFEKIKLPHMHDTTWSSFLGKLITRAKNKMLEMTEAQHAAVKKLEEITSKVLECKDVENLESLLPEIEVLSPQYRAQVSQTFDNRYVAVWTEKIEQADSFDFLADLMEPLKGIKDKYKPKLNPIIQGKYVETWKEKYFQHAKNHEDFNVLIDHANKVEKGFEKPIKLAVMTQAAKLKIIFDKNAKKFIKAPKIPLKPEEKKPEEPIKA
jgi:hypothetical protein